MKHDKAEIIRALNVLKPSGEITELRVLEACRRGSRWAGTESGYYDNWETLANDVGLFAEADGFYFTPQKINPALLARSANRIRNPKKHPTTSDSNVERYCWLLIDCDPVRPSGISSSNDEHKAAHDRTAYISMSLSLDGWPNGIDADSGNGAHLLYQIDLEANEENAAIISDALKALNAEFSTDVIKVDLTTFNPARIWKLYGTLAGKGDSTPDRPHRLSRLLHVPKSIETVTLEQLKALAGKAAAGDEKPSGDNHSSNGKSVFDAQQWLEVWIKKHKVSVALAEKCTDGIRYRFDQCPFNSSHGKNDAALTIRNGKLGFKCFHDGCANKQWDDYRELIEPKAGRKTSSDSPKGKKAAPVIREAITIALDKVERKIVQWLWLNRIALGKLTLYFGDPGLGKSFLTLDATSRISTGTPWPDGSPCPMGSTILISYEDDVADTIAQRLDQMHADGSRIFAIEGVKVRGEAGDRERSFTLDDLDVLRAELLKHSDCKLVVIDPVSAGLSDTDSHNNAEIRGLLAPLAKLAADFGVAIIMVTHMSKGGGGRAMYRAMGSLAFIAAARAAYVVVKDQNDQRRRLFLPTKNNLGNDETGLAYSIIDGAVCWERDPVTITADDALEATVEEAKPGPKPEARSAAKNWLREILAQGDVTVEKLKEDAEAAGMAWRTVQRAANDLDVISEKNSFSGGWQWRLPKPGNQPENEDAKPTCQVPSSSNNLASWHVREKQSVSSDFRPLNSQDAKSPVHGTFDPNAELEPVVVSTMVDNREGGDL